MLCTAKSINGDEVRFRKHSLYVTYILNILFKLSDNWQWIQTTEHWQSIQMIMKNWQIIQILCFACLHVTWRWKHNLPLGVMESSEITESQCLESSMNIKKLNGTYIYFVVLLCLFFCFFWVLDNSYANILELLFCELEISILSVVITHF